MDRFGLRYHHLGLAVREPMQAQAFLEGLSYRFSETIFDPEQNVNLVMATHDNMPAVEIIWPSNRSSPVNGMLGRHPKGLVYHICYAVENLSDCLHGLQHAGLEAVCVSLPKPAILFGGQRVSFYMIMGIGLIELIEVSVAR